MCIEILRFLRGQKLDIHHAHSGLCPSEVSRLSIPVADTRFESKRYLVAYLKHEIELIHLIIASIPPNIRLQ